MLKGDDEMKGERNSRESISKAQKMIWEYKKFFLETTIAEMLHYEYERLAKEVGWKTQKDCQVKYHNLPTANLKVMVGMGKFVQELRKMKDYEIINKGRGKIKAK